jgi:hypothetical protein
MRPSNQSVFILLNPKRQSVAQDALISACKGWRTTIDIQQHAFSLGPIFLECHLGDWEAYMGHYEHQLEELVSQNLFAHPERHSQACSQDRCLDRDPRSTGAHNQHI